MPMVRRPKNLYDMLPVLLVDAYKLGHPFQYPKDTTMVYSNNTPRKSRVRGVQRMNAFGMQYYRDEYLIRQFNENFFGLPKDLVLKEYRRRVENYIGPLPHYDHIAGLHELGYLPLLVKAVPEGMRVPMRTPILTVRNTHDDFAWLTNMGETTQSNVLWLPCTSCTTAYGYRLCFEEWAEDTGGSREFIKWQGHDFSYRGMAGLEAAALSGAAHLMSFTGTDTLPAIDLLEMYYDADVDRGELVGGSVPATEHSVMCVGGKDDEEATIRRLITEVYPSGVVSVVSDTWDYWHVLTQVLPKLKTEIMARNGKYVTRPDSGDPVKMICGDPDSPIEHVRKGSVQVKWDIFGGTFTDKGYKTLDSHVGLIYGDSITRDIQDEIRQRLTAAGFASDNQVLGIGSYTYQMVTRDTFGNAIKATYAERKSCGGFPIFKDPVTDTGMKKSAVGLLYVGDDMVLEENVTWEREAQGSLQAIFCDGKSVRTESAMTIRARMDRQVDAHLHARRSATVPNVLVS